MNCVFLLAVPLTPSAPSILCLLVGTLALGFVTPQGHAINQTMAGPQRAGTWISILLLFSNFSGIVGPIATGFIVDRTGAFFWASAAMSTIACFGIVSILVLANKIEPIAWPSAEPEQISPSLVATN